MITFRAIDLDREYHILEMWWWTHGSPPMPKMFLPEGWFAVDEAGTLIAASFLYLDRGGRCAVIEMTTTNPECRGSRSLVAAVKGLWAKLEEEARAAGCQGLISFVKPGGSEERLMRRAGWLGSADDPGHRLLAKNLVGSVPRASGGVVPCP